MKTAQIIHHKKIWDQGSSEIQVVRDSEEESETKKSQVSEVSGLSWILFEEEYR